MKVRFAPSPTGLLHVGNARVALLNWLWARKEGGRFLLRLDDTDSERSTQAYAEAILRDLAWLGLSWDETARQSDRMERYADAVERLKEAGRLYPCWEAPEDLELKRKLAMKAGRPPIYDRAALSLSEDEKQSLLDAGRKPHWRFKLDHSAIDWPDAVRGPQHFDGQHLSDPVLLREDGRPLYTLSSVVDDIELGVTHVLRGEDHVANTAVQIQLFTALGGSVPVFAHLSLIADASGQGLSKRLGSLSLESLREQGLEPMALNSYLAKLGTSDPIEAHAEMESLVAGFDISRFGRATPKFDPHELEPLNARVLQQLPYESVAETFSEAGCADFGAALWEAVRGNLARRQDALEWYRVVHDSIVPSIEDSEFCATAAELLPQEPWDQGTWKDWTAAVKQASGRKGRQLFLPLRLALTGRESGPELKDLLPLIGREKARERLMSASA
ncbi:glutamate--tRNA ligase [Aquibaculum arenosum]|uniref:Glutamate--tRNA ligase n=1 Tax=Aquibaculum arenosum TaxID=3032591 RepID=A0ABT5YN18_9PROT|nr:glutamate--tRNA ligase [Fodinicurvata sp. CAU 1616]MDF2096213.1 glutamate--tRNA ligase [Fodinicurvata sp. CAU 1616]